MVGQQNAFYGYTNILNWNDDHVRSVFLFDVLGSFAIDEIKGIVALSVSDKPMNDYFRWTTLTDNAGSSHRTRTLVSESGILTEEVQKHQGTYGVSFPFCDGRFLPSGLDKDLVDDFGLKQPIISVATGPLTKGWPDISSLVRYNGHSGRTRQLEAAKTDIDMTLREHKNYLLTNKPKIVLTTGPLLAGHIENYMQRSGIFAAR